MITATAKCNDARKSAKTSFIFYLSCVRAIRAIGVMTTESMNVRMHVIRLRAITATALTYRYGMSPGHHCWWLVNIINNRADRTRTLTHLRHATRRISVRCARVLQSINYE